MSEPDWAVVPREASWIVANGGVVPDGYKEMFDKAADFLDRSAKPIAWTKERPTKPGWYFTRMRDPRTGEPYACDCECFDDDDFARLPDFYFSGREFAGPVPEPVEPYK